jgi:pimeloyl-ACP methyl ester carboxylesterase
MNNKPLLVFIPGTLCTSEMFMPIVSNLPFETKMVEFTHQDNLPDMASEVLKVADGRAFIPVGFSMGGMVAFELLRMQLPQVSGMILLNSNSHADIPGRKMARDIHLAMAQSQGIETLVRQHYLPVYFDQPLCPESETVVKMASQLGVKTFAAQLRVLDERPDSLNVLTNFMKPLLIVGAQNDRPCPPEHQKVMAHAARQSELHILNDCGHFAPLKAPLSIANLVIKWVNTYYA